MPFTKFQQQKKQALQCWWKRRIRPCWWAFARCAACWTTMIWFALRHSGFASFNSKHNAATPTSSSLLWYVLACVAESVCACIRWCWLSPTHTHTHTHTHAHTHAFSPGAGSHMRVSGWQDPRTAAATARCDQRVVQVYPRASSLRTNSQPPLSHTQTDKQTRTNTHTNTHTQTHTHKHTHTLSLSLSLLFSSISPPMPSH